MSDKSNLASKLYTKWEEIQTQTAPAPRCFIGFDGFTDEIIHAVDKRASQSDYKPFQNIADFGQRIVGASGKSCNIEFVVQRKKLGGNAPIMTNALLSGGHAITFAGAIGFPGKIEPIFEEMARGCTKVIPLGPSAHSDAIEFEDGKVILGKLSALVNINYHALLAHIPKEELIATLDVTNLFVCANWTMLPMMNDLWRHIIKDIAPKFKKKDQIRYLFVDLADPAKREDTDIKDALELLRLLNENGFHVILGLNEAEAMRILHVLTDNQNHSHGNAQDLVEAIFRHSNLHMIVVHATQFAMAATADGVVEAKGPYYSKPKITTGAGDNFNAGFCTALLYGLSPKECLLSGVTTSGFYVRRGTSPTIPELAAFLHQWAEVGNAQLIN